MKRRIVLFHAGMAVALLTALTGCETTGQSAGLGAALGAGAGAIIGHQSGHALEGAAIGALVGGATGAIAKDVQNKRQASRDDGTWLSVQQIKLPNDLARGRYTIQQVINVNGNIVSGASGFTVQ